MINYIWFAMIVLAIGYAAFQDVTGKMPPTEEPAPVIMSFESGSESPADISIDSAYGFRSSASASFSLQFQDEQEMLAGLEVSIPAEYEYTPIGKEKANAMQAERLIFQAASDTPVKEAHTIFRDSDGELFRSEKSFAIEKAGEWRTVIVPLQNLAPAPENPDAKLNAPITLVGFAIVRPEAVPAGGVVIHIDDVALGLPEIVNVKEDVKAKSWMGVATNSAVYYAEYSIKLAIGLIGIMMLWLGLMRIAEKAGLVQILARLVKPIMVWLYPEVPPESDAMGAIVMNVAGNMFGLGNAGTALGINAMKELQAINASDEYASNAQCMLLAMNTSSVTLIPATIMAYRAAAGSTNLMVFWPMMLGATFASTIFAVMGCKLLEKLPIFRIPSEALNKQVITREDAK